MRECILEVEKVKKCDDDSWPIYHRVGEERGKAKNCYRIPSCRDE